MKVMKSQLAATRAPRVALRLATVYPRSHQPGPSIASVKLFVHNTGLSSAVIVGAGFYLEWQRTKQAREPAKLRPGGEDNLSKGVVIAAGETLEVTVSDSACMWPAAGWHTTAGDGTSLFLHLSGRIDYTDDEELLAPRTTAFYRYFKGDEDHRLLPLDQPGLEFNT